ncbi:uncharacterized protein SPPG_00210 [Spizellomyces punctatus DAOM BR117]|uniref:Uncharacterized protein n=1 Tax=Spizellomyces punctatus (strain DAOM BR117) TaxID=645134 RepID=A0A0L0HTR0_SPIPD|nr:uncharacterized protein SPPG_00210 [Spizellomyces punctatus DAOM BR117]KND04482.1 hypothetical protein SPPG_00210 [Spizellomyces punctatus DAOM BR117]|eukprot:XP_016612521.1 hypothetical protein SPPG_00210 [Spizellomyces punctatus DAOM BR117]
MYSIRQENGDAGNLAVSRSRIDTNKQHVCPVCGQPAAVVELRKEVDDLPLIPEEVEKIFIPAIVHLEDTVKVWKLQYGNAVRLLRYLKIKTSEYNRKYREAVRYMSKESYARSTHKHIFFRTLNKAQDEIMTQRHQMELLKQSIATESPTRLKEVPKNNGIPLTERSPTTGNSRPNSSRSLGTSPSRNSKRAIQTPNPPSRLSLRPNSRGVNGPGSINGVNHFQDVAAVSFQPDPMDLQSNQVMYPHSHQQNDATFANQNHYRTPLYANHDSYRGIGPGTTAEVATGYHQTPWTGHSHFNSRPTNGATSPRTTQNQFNPIGPGNIAQTSNAGYMANGIPRTPVKNSSSMGSFNSRPRTAMRVPFNPQGPGSIMSSSMTSPLLNRSSGAANEYMQNSLGLPSYTTTPISGASFHDGRTMLTRNRNAFPRAGGSAYM